MLPPFIIEQIRRREEQERLKQEADRPRLQLPLDAYRPALEDVEAERDTYRGMVIIEL
jgi:hypothetical protein